MMAGLAMVLGVLLDCGLGEPRRWHPLVGFGRLAGWIVDRIYAPSRCRGLWAWTLAVLPLTALVAATVYLAAAVSVWAELLLQALWLYMCIGLRSLGEHAKPIIEALRAGQIESARQAVAMIVSRDTARLSPRQIAVAATESMLENGSDAVFATLFWFAVCGAPGAVAYRLANTLDAMWGYRTPRYRAFGWAAARIDDVLNYIPARLVALSYAVLGHFTGSVQCWRRQARRWDSPNAGPVMAAGAGALAVRLGGGAPYHGQWKRRPRLGYGRAADADSIQAGLRLVQRGCLGWCLLYLLLGWVKGVWLDA